MRGGGGSLRDMRGIGVGERGSVERGSVCVGGMGGCGVECGWGGRGGWQSGAEVMVERG